MAGGTVRSRDRRDEGSEGVGTDIHGWVQVRNNGKSEWLTVEEIYDDRNYILFDLLAGGRSGDTGPVRPFEQARGLPDDYQVNRKCAEYCAHDEDFEGDHYIKDWWATPEGGGHSQSWWDLRELVLHPGWDWSYTQSGWISRERFESWDHREPPYPYSGYVGGHLVRHAEYGPDGIEGPEDWTYIKVTWVETPASNCHVFMKWADYVLAKYEWAKDVRIVFGFDC